MGEQSETPASPEGQEQKELQRSAVIHEAWVGDPQNPGVFIMLALKKGQLWWELPGGKIEGNPSTPEDIKKEAEREWREEVLIDAQPNSTLEAVPLAGFDPDSTSDIETDDKRKIITHPFIIRQTFDTLPRLQAIMPQQLVHEHNGYWWLDVSPIYYEGNQAPRKDLESRFQTDKMFRIVNNLSEKNYLERLAAWGESTYDALRLDGSEETLQKWGIGTYSARQEGKLTDADLQIVPISLMTSRVLEHYFSPDHAMEPPAGMQRPQFTPVK